MRPPLPKRSESMPFKIDKNLPIPPRPRRKRTSKYPLTDMEVGDSFFVPTGPFKAAQESKMKSIRTRLTYLRNEKRIEPHARFEHRVVTEGNRTGVRVWRIANAVGVLRRSG